jgi:hypothetical protein
VIIRARQRPLRALREQLFLRSGVRASGAVARSSLTRFTSYMSELTSAAGPLSRRAPEAAEPPAFLPAHHLAPRAVFPQRAVRRALTGRVLPAAQSPAGTRKASPAPADRRHLLGDQRSTEPEGQQAAGATHLVSMSQTPAKPPPERRVSLRPSERQSPDRRARGCYGRANTSSASSPWNRQSRAQSGPGYTTRCSPDPGALLGSQAATMGGGRFVGSQQSMQPRR